MQGCTFCCFKAKPWRYFDNECIAVHSRSDPKSAMTKRSYGITEQTNIGGFKSVSQAQVFKEHACFYDAERIIK